MGKITLHSFIVLCSLLIIVSAPLHAETNDVKETCDYTETEGENPSYQTMNCLLTEIALNHNVPPEIVKSIADTESGGWKQFDETTGEPIVTEDGGIGVMQVTNKSEYNNEKLKNNIPYNIKAGVEILKSMFERSDLPQINQMNPQFLENWYFAIMAYNGTKPVNSPVVQATGERNTDAYQEKVIQNINNNSLIELETISFSPEDFDYNPDSTDNIDFTTMDYSIDEPLTKSKHLFETDTPVTATTDDLTVRVEPTTSSARVTLLNPDDIAYIDGDFVYGEDETSQNHFVWYPVRLENGHEGYVASSFLKMHFKDVPNDHYSTDAIYYLANRDLLQGVGGGAFGFDQDLTRTQAAILLNRANDVSLDGRPDVPFTDVPNDYNYYNHIAAAADEGFFEGNSDGSFGIQDSLTRAAMAQVLQRIYQFPEASGNNPFTDVSEDAWYRQAVLNLYEAGITSGVADNQFAPQQTVTRQQFAVFLTRILKND
ncbi:hypothetical protein ABID56_001162 [Alkalibacillus flavidus]|uniref:SLH domain-containing protein n=1 Tax=Alkalibacillus flavidus TaxID=546021 RepID=A0ABV2KVD2_9BACI